MDQAATPADAFSHEIRRPEVWASGVIVCSPHSGRDFPDWFLDESCLDIATLRSSEDAYMDQLIEPALAAGAVTLTARLPRSIVDLNRSASELDPDAVQCGPRRPATPRAMAGLGVIPRVVAGARPIRNAPITMDEAQRRIETYWRPYHHALRRLIDEALSSFGWAIVLDMHSMPHDAVGHLIPPQPEVVIGDRHGVSCNAVLRERVCALFRQSGFGLRLNAPFSGAYVATAYGRPTQSVHVLQIEIDRALYLDEQRMEPSPSYNAFAERLANILTQAALLRPDAGRVKVAAE
ncbi:N-formylglutamate amidohydrolase [Paracoccus sediminicola]|uniref:N-formylglutamate amidohydrolase n=1 Tax=Paracoccus sediminicola TaxID=3017783 RepID=UPI0022F0C444|nr:N-formylglutamate amidohydrolase [Paracoccus sediminicola]WBU56316.1 N-formylglutamate amidohydrolase [Paracoccus sediminicola]